MNDLKPPPRNAGEADGYNSAWHETWRQDDYELEHDRLHYRQGWDKGHQRGVAAKERLRAMEERLGVDRVQPVQRVAPKSFTGPRGLSGAMKIKQARNRDHFRKKTVSGSKVKNKRLFGR